MTPANNQQFQAFLTELAKGMRGHAWVVGAVLPDGEIVSASNLPPEKQQSLLAHLHKSFADQAVTWGRTVEIDTKDPAGGT